ncbi:hypothetical protein ACFLWY_04065 [Chloroflexota bacterium]
MGPAAEVKDQGAKVIAAIASILGISEEKELSEVELAGLIDSIKDPVGTFYRYTLPTSLLNRKMEMK